MLFIDCMKAFDKVFIYKLWDKKRNKGYSEHLIRTIEGMYGHTIICIYIRRAVCSESEMTNQGVRQG
jgi:hypothetical protein